MLANLQFLSRDQKHTFLDFKYEFFSCKLEIFAIITPNH